ncbi:FAD/NAD(P)-binding protein [Candidatus Woesearchaeota archaeon]|nr:FAD/NAD(P)-binding protein [Candidatus Woesearchaeota archaeon]
MSIFQAKRYRIKEVLPQTDDNVMLRVKTRLNPQPGQFVEVSIPGVGEAPISSASCNNEFLDLNVRIVGAVTEAITKMKKGEQVHLRGPYGRGYPMDYLRGKNIVLVGGGCGVAPLRGIIEFIDKHRMDYKEIYLFFGFRSPADVLFKDEIDDWSKKYNLNMSVDKAPEDNPFNCSVGFVTKLLENAELSTDNTEVLTCGPSIMIDKCIDILKSKGFSDDKLWESYERHMKCSTGKCGHCMINGKYVCMDGPVFRHDEVKGIDE